ncbi:hypothetical protein F5887DRAFT_189346 [Amanita rubescens]|nr:hypothetical protein F5887DRAFT_189346 [Amanita rubescens]
MLLLFRCTFVNLKSAPASFLAFLAPAPRIRPVQSFDCPSLDSWNPYSYQSWHLLTGAVVSMIPSETCQTNCSATSLFYAIRTPHSGSRSMADSEFRINLSSCKCVRGGARSH